MSKKVKYLAAGIHVLESPIEYHGYNFSAGTTIYVKHNQIYRDRDYPAVVTDDCEIYFKDNKFHRDHKPAMIWKNGQEEWYQNGVRHRNDGPAITTPLFQSWWKDGKQHRDNDLPAYICVNGNTKWLKHGELHRDNDLPAHIDANNTKKWFQHGKMKREFGPVIIGEHPYKEVGYYGYHLDGKFLNRDNEIKQWIEDNDIPPFEEWTDEHKVLFTLSFSN